MKKEKTREYLIKIFASDYGHGPEVTAQFTTDELRKAFNSERPYEYIKALIELKKTNKKSL